MGHEKGEDPDLIIQRRHCHPWVGRSRTSEGPLLGEGCAIKTGFGKGKGRKVSANQQRLSGKQPRNKYPDFNLFHPLIHWCFLWAKPKEKPRARDTVTKHASLPGSEQWPGRQDSQC